MKQTIRKSFVVSFLVLTSLAMLFVSSCGEKTVQPEEQISLSREEILALSGIEESEIDFSKVKLDVSGKPQLSIAVYDGEGREIFSKDFPPSEVKGGYVTIAVIKSEVLDALRFLYGVTDSKGSLSSIVQDLPYFQYQNVVVSNADVPRISSKGEFRLSSVTFGQERQEIFLRVK
ncbi:MAG TPA: hypothetical protein ENN47_03965 [Mesotoga infera]|uniref:Lipoprotein n=1 Tax=Mesotoga infera TaxID=1236046 RepID=A0A7C1CV24_9BACT|nr:hypothetical protein [Mesotoga infera]